MQAGLELPGQQPIDEPVPRHPVQPVKTRTGNGDVEMRLPPVTQSLCTGMMGMTGAVILDFELRGREFALEDHLDPFASGEMRRGRA